MYTYAEKIARCNMYLVNANIHVKHDSTHGDVHVKYDSTHGSVHVKCDSTHSNVQ